MPKWTIDPDFASFAEQARVPLRDAQVVRDAALLARENAPALPASELEIQTLSVARSGDDETQLYLRIYRRKDAPYPLPVLLYFHGGGFFCGDIASDELQCTHYALNAACAVVTVSYRLAPENPFPAALTDCYRVLEFLAQKGQELKLDKELIAVGGSSAGANLAAAVTLLARDRKGPRLCFQMLLVPALDDRLETESAHQFTDVPDFAKAEAEVMWRWYLGSMSHPISPYAAPARAEHLTDLPAAYILCAGLDPLRDEGLQYAQRLIEAGVAVELHLLPFIPHGFASVPAADVSQRLLKEQAEVLRCAFQWKRKTLDDV
jgi:acetyl esterase